MPPPNTPAVVKRYYPALSSVVSLDDFPESLGFIKQGLQSLFSKIHYKDLQYKKSPKGDAAFYSLTIVSRKLAIELFGSGVSLVLNPDESGDPDFNISAFPVTVEYQWKILAYLRSFDLDNFSFTPQEFFELGLIILNVSEEQALAHFINTFTVPDNENILPLEQFVNDLQESNTELANLGIVINIDTKLKEVVQAINQHTQKYATLYAFGTYLLQNDLNDTKKKLGEFFKKFIPDDIESYIKDILVPKAKVTLTVSAAIEFPRNILYPYKQNGAIWEREPEGSGVLSRFYFGKILLYADTQKGIGYNMDLVGDLAPQYSEIGNTGLLLQLQKLKIDISDKVNIPEADADGRPTDFRGVYADALSVTLPSKWFKTGANTNGSTLRIGGYNLLIGTGGVSGTFALEAVPTQNASDGEIIDFFSSKFEFVYPITGIINNTVTKEEENIVIANETELLTYLNSLSNKHLYAFKFPLEISPASGSNIIFNGQQEFRNYITNLVVEENGTMWINIGSEENGFLVGFKRFDISFRQNKVISSNLRGALEIKKFVYPEGAVDANGNSIAGQTVHIDIDGHLYDNGDFNLTASANPAYDLKLPGVLTYGVKTVELGKEDDDYYIGTSGTLKFDDVPILSNLQAIEIDRLRIYSDGTIEIKGGSIQLIKPIVLPLGPVEITVTAIHYGSHQKEVDGVMRKFNYFGFDGGVSIDPLGIEVRGDGVKLYYCSDNLPNKPNPYLHIQTLYVDLTIPASSPVAIINGWLSIPEPGTSPEYMGGIKIKLPKAKISGSADMRLMPKYPAFIIDAEVEFPAPIPLGSFAIYGFRGLLGYRYVAEKEAIGLVSGVNTWYEYYKAPPRGIHVKKFSGPNQTKQSGTPFSIGAGASLGTSYDNGTTLNIKAMVLLSVPSLFMIDGRASLISARLGLEDTKDPPFFAFVALGDNSLEFGFGADFKMPTSSGSILSLYADVQAAFFFNDSSKWYVNIGTRTNPVTARILTLITLQSYLMMSAKGIEAGARGEFIFKKSYGPVKVSAWAYVEVGGKISFERPQVGGYIAAGVGAEIDIRILHLYIAIDLLFGAESPKPFLIYGKFRLCVKVKICFIKIKFCGQVEISWDFNKTIERAPINPLINAGSSKPIEDIVVGVNMLTNDTFELAYLGGTMPSGLDTKILNKIIPLDTYIDIKTEKGLLPGGVSGKIGGVNNAPSRYTDLIPPDAVVRGKAMRQVKHQYLIDEISIMSWDDTNNIWKEYNPYKALYPDDGTLNNLKIGQWQKVDGQYNTIRLLATNPFSYTEQGEPGWHIPEQYGVTPSSLFCESHHREYNCADFLSIALGRRFYCYDIDNHFFFSNEAAFMLLNSEDDEFAEVVDDGNIFDFEQSLSFPNHNQLQIILPDPASKIDLRLSSFADGVKIKYYAAHVDVNDNQVQYRHPNTALNSSAPYEVFVPISHLAMPIEYSQSIIPGWKAITKVVIEPVYPNAALIHSLQEQIAVIEEHNMQILLEGLEEPYQTTAVLEDQLNHLLCSRGSIVRERYRFDSQDNIHALVDSNNNVGPWTQTWDLDNEVKFEENLFGFRRDGNKFIIACDYEVVNIKLLERVPSDNVPMPSYVVEYDGANALLTIDPLAVDYLLGSDVYNFEITYFNTNVNSHCSVSDPAMCVVYHQIFDILAHNFEVTQPIDLSSYQAFTAQIVTILKASGYESQIDEIREHYDVLVVFNHLSGQNLTIQSFNEAVIAIENVLAILNEIGNCKCGCDGEIMNTLFHKICWLTLEDYEYNLNIPSQQAIEADSQATIDGISKFIQPIWRPDTSYIVKFRLKDIVDNGFSTTPYNYVYGFTTAGPVGFFHTHEKATYGDIKLTPTTILDDTTGIVRDNNGVIVLPNQEPHPDKYPLTSLRHYIDYNRSYPNADGNLLSAKPLFYGDGDNTKVSLYFTKSYAVHFFQDWQLYNGMDVLKSKLKIVIKDPREDVSISNPPSLDNVVSTIDIPQTVETWTEDAINPLVPFVTSQWINMFNANTCVGTGQIIKPKSKYVSVELKQLKPSKLYTAIINGVYDVYKDGVLGPVPNPNDPNELLYQDEIREVHKFVFQTSRYANFNKQIQSYKLDEAAGVNAVFTIEKSFTTDLINAALKTIKGESLSGVLSDAVLNRINTNYQHAYDRIFEGILGLEPLDEAVTTEFNIIRNSSDANTVFAVIVRNPEPFNNPKMIDGDLTDTLRVLLQDTSNQDTNYFVLFSKDRSQAIIMHNSLAINVNSLRIGFTYKLWNGNGYTVSPIEVAQISF
ncbi:MAG TPA: hypothetical protein VJL37_11540 [Flavobacterium sp.]|nr:hypothetical protein [Flavobacterium sp.]